MIVRVTNPAVFATPLVREFFEAATKANKFLDPQCLEDLSQMVAQPEVGCFVDITDDGPGAAMVVMLPQSAFMDCAQVLLIYGKAHNSTDEVVKAGLKFATDAGYNRAWGLNRSGAADEAIERLFAPHVAYVRPIGTLMEYEF